MLSFLCGYRKSIYAVIQNTCHDTVLSLLLHSSQEADNVQATIVEPLLRSDQKLELEKIISSLNQDNRYYVEIFEIQVFVEEAQVYHFLTRMRGEAQTLQSPDYFRD